MSFASFKIDVTNKLFTYKSLQDLALNNPQRLICHKTQPNQVNPHCWSFFSSLPLATYKIVKWSIQIYWHSIVTGNQRLSRHINHQTILTDMWGDNKWQTWHWWKD